MSFKKVYKSYGNKAILVEWEAKIDAAILADITSFKIKILTNLKTKINDVVIGYNSLLVKFKSPFDAVNKEIERLKKVDQLPVENSQEENYLWEIPVCYDEKFGLDLGFIAEKNQLEISEIIQLHSAAIYTVYFIGFLPGFLYLGGLNEQLHISRKEAPRLQVDARSIAIGGNQTGIYPNASAGGWQIIGKTPISFFKVDSKNPCFAKAGDQIKFVPISLEEFYRLETRNPIPKKIKIK